MLAKFLGRNKIRKWADRWKIITGIIMFLVLITTLILNFSGVLGLFFPSEDIVFKTTDIFPDPTDDIYPLAILAGGEIVSIANPVPQEDMPTEVSGPPNNVNFTVTNNSEQELLVDKIEAILIEYKNIPEKCIYAFGPLEMLQPIDLLLVLSPDQNKYDLSRGRYFSIASGKTEHVFQVWVSGKQPGIYRFKVQLTCRIGGKKGHLVESDFTYTFLVPDYSKGAKCHFLYLCDQTDPNFRNLIEIANMPLVDYERIISSWGEYKLLDCIHNAPQNLKDFMRILRLRQSSEIMRIPPGLVTKDASEIVLSPSDMRWCSLLVEKSRYPTPKVTFSEEDLPDWMLNNRTSDNGHQALSAFSVKYSIHTNDSVCVLYNTVAVYPTVELAHEAYVDTKPSDRPCYRLPTYRDIGDECYETRGTSAEDEMTTLVFRKKNVVVAFVAMPSYPLAIFEYVPIIENKI